MKFSVKKRDVFGKKVKHLRKDEIVPATVYGPKFESTSIQFDSKMFKDLFGKVGYSKFFELEIEGQKPMRALIKDVDIHPIKDYYQSVSIYAVDEESKLNVDVPIVLVGESPAVTKKIGFLVTPIYEISVHCFPKDLPEVFEINIGLLENIGDVITVGSIKLPEHVELSSSMDSTSAVAYIAAPQRLVETTDTAAAVTTESAEPEAGTAKAEAK